MGKFEWGTRTALILALVALVGVAGVTVAGVAADLADDSSSGEDGYVEGTVTDAETGEPLEGVEIATGSVVTEIETAKTDSDGEYVLTTDTGQNQLTAYTFGYEYEEATVEVEPGETAVQNFSLEPTVFDATVEDRQTPVAESGETVSTTVQVANAETITYEIDGDYDGDPELTVDGEGVVTGEPYLADDGEYELELDTESDAEGTVSIEVEVTDGDETVSPETGSTLVVEEHVSVGVVDDAGDHGEAVADSIDRWFPDIVETPVVGGDEYDDHDAFVVQHLDEANTTEFVEATADGDVGVVYLDQAGEASNGVTAFGSETDAVGSTEESVDGSEINVGVEAEPEMFGRNLEVGDTVPVHEADEGHHAWVETTEFEVLASVTDGNETQGPAVVIDDDSNTALAASHGQSDVVTEEVLTGFAESLRANLVETVLENQGDPVRGGIEVTVTDAESGEPLEGVGILSAGNFRLTTDEDGHTHIDGQSPGGVMATVSSEGYHDLETSFVVEPGETTTEHIEFEPKDGTIEGRVTDADTGEPIEGVVVQRGHVRAPVPSPSSPHTDVTDANGTYAIPTSPTTNDSLLHPVPVHVAPIGYEQETAAADVDPGETTVQDFELEPTLDVGVVDRAPRTVESGENVSATVEVAHAEEIRVDVDGAYDGDVDLSVDGHDVEIGTPVGNNSRTFPGGEHELELQTEPGADGPLDVTVTVADGNETVTTDIAESGFGVIWHGTTLVLEDGHASVGVVDDAGDHGAAVADSLDEEFPHNVETAVVGGDELGDHDAFVVQHIDEDHAADFVDATADGDVGVVYLEQAGEASNGITAFVDESGTAEVGPVHDATEKSGVEMRVEADTDVFGLERDVGDTVAVHEAAEGHYAWLEHTEYEELTSLTEGSEGSETLGPAVAIDDETNTALAASLGQTDVVTEETLTWRATTLRANLVEAVLENQGQPVRGDFEITVTDAETGAPVPNAEIIRHDFVMYETDENGTYASEDVEPGYREATVSHDEYEDRETGYAVEPGESTHQIELEPVNGTDDGDDSGSDDGTSGGGGSGGGAPGGVGDETATVEVQVVDAADAENALADATVVVDGLTVTTDADGIATVAVDPGSYDVEATLDGYEDETVESVTVDADETETVAVELAESGADVGPDADEAEESGEERDDDDAADASDDEALTGFGVVTALVAATVLVAVSAGRKRR